MADELELTFTGDWRVTVQSRSAAFDQRVLILNAKTGGEILGVPGSNLDVYANESTPWKLRIEHRPPGQDWAPSWVRLGARTVSGARITQIVESEDETTPASDRDFNDLIVRLERIGMVEQTIAPFAVMPSTLLAMPEGVFETALGRYFAAVHIRNIWGQDWPSSAQVGITDRSREWLRQAGIAVVDEWSSGDQAAFAQQVSNGRVQVGALPSGQETIIYFKLDVSAAPARKNLLEVQVFSPDEPVELRSPRARAPLLTSRTTFDPTAKTFRCEVDKGAMTLRVREFTAEYGSLKIAISKAIELFGLPTGGQSVGGRRRCDRIEVERIRGRLRNFLAGKDADICGIWRDIQRCCAGGGTPEPPGVDWVGIGVTGVEFIVIPTVIDYTIDYKSPFPGQYGPIPYEDPWWKIALLIVAILLAVAAYVSAAADIANHGSDVVIGQIERGVLDATSTPPATDPPREQVGSVDTCLTKLNDQRGHTQRVFSYLDAASGEANTTPIGTLGGRIDTEGTIMTNAELQNVLDNQSKFPDQLQVYKSGARTGLTRAIIDGIIPVADRDNDDGSKIYFINQVRFVPDDNHPAAENRITRPGDSGSLWLQVGTNKIVAQHHAGPEDGSSATGSRIEDVMTKLNIRFG